MVSSTHTCPGVAADWTREAVFTGSPATMPCCSAPMVTATSPVTMPTRIARLGDAEVRADRRHRVDQLEARAHRALGVVLVRGRDAPDRHHRVADELLDGAAVAVDDLRGTRRSSRDSSSRTSSWSRLSDSVVNPTRSPNSTLVTRRSATGWARAWCCDGSRRRGARQLLQNFTPRAREERRVTEIVGGLADTPDDPTRRPDLDDYQARAAEATPPDASPEVRAQVSRMARIEQARADRAWQAARGRAATGALDWLGANPAVPLMAMPADLRDGLSPEQMDRWMLRRSTAAASSRTATSTTGSTTRPCATRKTSPASISRNTGCRSATAITTA